MFSRKIAKAIGLINRCLTQEKMTSSLRLVGNAALPPAPKSTVSLGSTPYLAQKTRTNLLLNYLRDGELKPDQTTLFLECKKYEIEKWLEENSVNYEIITNFWHADKKKFDETSFDDRTFDGLFMLDFLAELRPNQRRLALLECSRILKKEGIAVFSTSLDLKTESPSLFFQQLVQTEFDILEEIPVYDGLWIILRAFLKGPLYFAEAASNSEIKKVRLNTLTGWKRWIFKINTSEMPGRFWEFFSRAYAPIFRLFERSSWIYSLSSKLGRRFFQTASLAHVSVIAKRK